MINKKDNILKVMNMKKTYKFLFQLILFTFFVFSSKSVYSSHIVGGEMTYRCLGITKDQVKIQVRFTLRRDCFNGSPEAEFDSIAHVGIFNSSGKILRELGKYGVIQMPFNKDDTLNEILKTECEVVGGDVCVHTTTYFATITLPFRSGGYIFAYQRCCRNKTITNIVEPELQGATYSLVVTEDALRYCNSSPTFGEWPAIYVCGDRPISFNHASKDLEGDSLVYTLCEPYSGADTANAKPSTPPGPPYAPIVYKAPYSLLNLLGGFPELRIDRFTGLLTGQPDKGTTGQFLVGVCVSEYRNGRLLSQTRRDFQYNVRICTTNPVSTFEPDQDVLCQGDRTVLFTNKSINAKEFTWFFDYPNTTPFAKDTNPSFTFPKSGKYTVALVSRRAKDCIDTSYKDIYVFDSTQLGANFDIAYGSCDDSINISLKNKSFDSLLNIVKWDWNATVGGKDYQSNDVDPIFNFPDTGKLHIKLIVTSSGGCLDSLEKEVYVNRLKPNFPASSIPICIGEKTKIISNPDNRFKYTWSPGEGLSCVDCPDPIANPDSTRMYYVTVTDGQCTEIDSVTIKVSKLLDIDIQADSIICKDSVSLRGIGGVEQTIEWSNLNDFSNIIQSGSFNLNTVVLDKQTFYIRAKSQFNCPGNDSITITNKKVKTKLITTDVKACEQDTFTLIINNEVPEQMLDYRWTPSTYILSGQGTTTIKGLVQKCEDQTFYINTENEFQCRANDTVHVDIICKPLVDFAVDKNCDKTLVSFINQSDKGSYFWDFGDNNTSTDKDPLHDFKKTGRYLVTLKIKGECTNEITKVIDVGFIKVNLNDTILSCNGEPVHINPNPDLNYKYQWFPATNLDDANIPNPLADVDTTTTYKVRISDPIFSDCFIERAVTIFVPPAIDLKINSDTVLCYSDTINLQATTKFSTKVEWYNRVLQFLGDGYQLKRQVSDSGYIYAYATDRYGCSENDSFKVIPIKTKYDPLLPFDLCPGADRTIEFKTLNSHRYTFNWSPTKYIVTGEKTNRIIVKPVDTTVFYVDFVNEYGCAYRDSVQINISKFDPPLVAYAEEDTIYLGQSTVLHVNRDYKNYNWIIPYGLSCTDCTDPIATPENSILYSVEAVNEDGCVERTDVRVIVIRPKCDESDVYISNIFSPNGDRLNDEFRIRSNFLKEVEMVIYDRWGEKIFETFDLNHWWDGTYKGSQLPPDVYAYYFKVRCVDDQTYSKKGNVTIVR